VVLKLFLGVSNQYHRVYLFFTPTVLYVVIISSQNEIVRLTYYCRRVCPEMLVRVVRFIYFRHGRRVKNNMSY